jgi:hypothetical protein
MISPDFDAPKVQRVVCAAIRHADGRIVCGPRHFDRTMWCQLLGIPPSQWSERVDKFNDEVRSWQTASQGFIDQHGDFLTREEAWPIAEAQQSLLDPDWQRGVLHSEHLY